MNPQGARDFLQKQGAKRFVKVLIIGNSGRGKSFLCNALLGSEAFDHAWQGGSCTAENSVAPYMMKENSTGYLLYNIPGLIESDPANIKRNSECIEQAFRDFPEDFTMVLYVVCMQVGGRLLNEDVEAYRSIKQFVPQLGNTCTAVVVNMFEARKAKRAAVMTATTEQVKEMFHPKAVEFAPKAPDDAYDAHDKVDYTSQTMRTLQVLLVNMMQKLVPQRDVVPEENAKVQLDREKLQEQLAESNRQIRELTARTEREMREQRDEWEKKIAENNRQYEQRIAEASRGGGGCVAAHCTLATADGSALPIGAYTATSAAGCLKHRNVVDDNEFDEPLLLVGHQGGGKVLCETVILFTAAGRQVEMTPTHELLVVARPGDTTPRVMAAGCVEVGMSLVDFATEKPVAVVWKQRSRSVVCYFMTARTDNAAVSINGFAVLSTVVNDHTLMRRAARLLPFPGMVHHVAPPIVDGAQLVTRQFRRLTASLPTVKLF